MSAVPERPLHGRGAGPADEPRRPAEPPVPAPVARQAVEWLLRLQEGGPAEADREAWLRWRRADPLHEQAWQRIEGVNARLRGSNAPLASAVAQAKLDVETADSGRRRSLRRLSVLLLGGGGAAWLLHGQGAWPLLLADHRTAVGEQRTLTLPDGATLVLNTATAVDVRYTDSERRLVLHRGEIYLGTAPDSAPRARPFRVETAQGRVTPLGTRFSVRRHEAASEVAVFEGAVEIRPREAAAAALRLGAGQRARFSADAAGAPQAAEPTATAWTRGTLVAMSMRLDDFLAELARYSTDTLACDPAVAGLRVSGSYPTADLDRVLQTLPRVLPVELKVTPRFWGGRTLQVLPAGA